MTCSCLAGWCPLCAGATPTYRSVLAHRQAFQDSRGIQQSDPVAPVLAGRSPPQGESPSNVPGSAGVNPLFVVHAPIIDQERGECLSSKRSIP